MASHNQYRGYVKLPGKDLYHEQIRLDFNPRINVEPPKGASLEGFSLRLFVLKTNGKRDQPEISVTLRPEEWLDLIDAMKQEFERAQEGRKKMDGLC